tara:strand:+ start:217 stop:789 length:573 start_codon:yes stop_codon:yes gene_type:complete
MTWFDMIKTDSCTRETKQHLYLALEKLGANDELLKEVKTAPENEIIDMIEEFQMEFSGTSHEELFQELLNKHEKCMTKVMANENFSPHIQTKLASADILKSKKIDLVLFKEAVNEATVGETEVINDIDLLNKIKEIYRNKLIENDYSWSYINMQMKYKLIPSKMKSVLGRTLKGLGWKQSKYMGNRIWRR